MDKGIIEATFDPDNELVINCEQCGKELAVRNGTKPLRLYVLSVPFEIATKHYEKDVPRPPKGFTGLTCTCGAYEEVDMRVSPEVGTQLFHFSKSSSTDHDVEGGA